MYDATFDATYSPNKDLSVFGYITHENRRTNQTSYYSASFGGDNTYGLDSNYWSQRTNDMVDTIGLGSNWNAIENKLKLALNYSFSNAETQYQFFNNTEANAGASYADLPLLKTKTHRIDLTAAYIFDEAITINGLYRFEKMSTDDFALDDVGVIDNIIGFGNAGPNYIAHVIGVSTAIKF